jgi:hypothetical protein
MADGVKSCVRCGTDVTHQPRVRDPNGRYLCQPCVDAVKAQRAAKATASVAPSPPAEPAPSDADFEDASAVLDLAPVKASGFQPPPPKVLAENEELSLAPPDAATTKAGGRSAYGKAPKLPPVKCQNCGYDMKGLTEMKCPECGAKVRPRHSRDEFLEQESRRATIAAYRTPLIVWSVGLALTIVALLALGASTSTWIYVAISYIMGVIVGLVALVISSATVVEYDAPWHLRILCILAMFAVLAIVTAAFEAAGDTSTATGRGEVRVRSVQGLIKGGLLVIMAQTMLDLDPPDNYILAGIMWGVSIACNLATLWVVMNLL